MPPKSRIHRRRAAPPAVSNISHLLLQVHFDLSLARFPAWLDLHLSLARFPAWLDLHLACVLLGLAVLGLGGRARPRDRLGILAPAPRRRRDAT